MSGRRHMWEVCESKPPFQGIWRRMRHGQMVYIAKRDERYTPYIYYGEGGIRLGDHGSFADAEWQVDTMITSPDIAQRLVVRAKRAGRELANG